MSLTSKIQALLDYANGVTSAEDTTLGDAVKTLADGYISDWMVVAINTYKIPKANLVKAYNIDNEITRSFIGTERYLTGDAVAYIDTSIIYNRTYSYEISFKAYTPAANNGVFGARSASVGGLSTNDNLSILTSGYIDYFARYTISFAENTKYNIKFSPNDVSLNGQSVMTGEKSVDGVYPLSLFANNTAGTRRCSNSSISKFVEYNATGDCLHFFIPMVKDEVNGMYDLIGETFYSNANSSGSFTIN